MATVYYCTVEDVADALEEKASAYDLASIKTACASAADDVDDAVQLAAGSFRPLTAAKSFRWPDTQTSTYYRLWLDANRLLSLTSLVSGGVTIPSSGYYLEPQQYGPPYDRIEINLGSDSAWSFADTPQRAITATGLWGVSNDQADAGTLAASISTTTATTCTVSDASAVGIGDHLTVGTEVMIVSGRSWAAVSGGDTTGTLDASAAARTLAVADGTLYHEGELLLVDAERVKVVDIAGNNLTVLRAQDGSVLASHSSGVTVYARRGLVVSRGAQGSTAATHSSGSAVTRHVVAPAANDLAIASAVSTLLARRRGYTQQAGPQTSGGDKMIPASLDELRERVSCNYGRPVRTRVI
jgi:hypothetical protein